MAAVIPQQNQSQQSMTRQTKKLLLSGWRRAAWCESAALRQRQMFQLMRNSLLKLLCCPIIIKLVVVPFRSVINFNRLLSEVLLNCILLSFTRGKTSRTKSEGLVWEEQVWSIFPSYLTFSTGTMCMHAVELHTIKISHSPILNTLSLSPRDFYFFLSCRMFLISEDTCLIKYYLRICCCSTDC